MALIRFAEGQQRSGSIGGTVYSHNRFGAYVRARSVPVNPTTDRQVAVRNAVRTLTIAWQNTLTQFQRDVWDVYASNVTWVNKFGDAVHLTGANHYIRSNTALLVDGLGWHNDAPTIYNIATAEGQLSVTASEATQQLSVGFFAAQPWESEDDAYQFVYMGLPKNPSIKFFGGPWRLAGRLDGDSITPPTNPTLLPAPFPFAEGNRIWVRTRILRADGRLSEFAQVNFLGAA